MHEFPRWFIAAFCLLAMLPVAPARAQTDPGRPAISDQKLDAAAAAMAQVSDVQKKYEQKLAGTAPEDQDRVVEEANNALEKAVTDHGLSVDEYTTILETAQNDPSVREKLIRRLQSPAK